MKRVTQRLARIFAELVHALKGYLDLFLDWLRDAATHLFPTPVKVPVAANRPRPRSRKGRR